MGLLQSQSEAPAGERNRRRDLEGDAEDVEPVLHAASELVRELSGPIADQNPVARRAAGELGQGAEPRGARSRGDSEGANEHEGAADARAIERDHGPDVEVVDLPTGLAAGHRVRDPAPPEELLGGSMQDAVEHLVKARFGCDGSAHPSKASYLVWVLASSP